MNEASRIIQLWCHNTAYVMNNNYFIQLHFAVTVGFFLLQAGPQILSLTLFFCTRSYTVVLPTAWFVGWYSLYSINIHQGIQPHVSCVLTLNAGLCVDLNHNSWDQQNISGFIIRYYQVLAGVSFISVFLSVGMLRCYYSVRYGPNARGIFRPAHYLHTLVLPEHEHWYWHSGKPACSFPQHWEDQDTPSSCPRSKLPTCTSHHQWGESTPSCVWDMGYLLMPSKRFGVVLPTQLPAEDPTN